MSKTIKSSSKTYDSIATDEEPQSVGRSVKRTRKTNPLDKKNPANQLDNSSIQHKTITIVMIGTILALLFLCISAIKGVAPKATNRQDNYFDQIHTMLSNGSTLSLINDHQYDQAIESDTPWTWYNEPLEWAFINNEGDLYVKVASQTDYWQNTYYPNGKGGYHADNAPFYHTTFDGNFVASVKFTGHFLHLYDQAGLMVRINSRNWLKCGVEYTMGKQHASTAITRNGFSDWSILNLETVQQEQQQQQHDASSIFFQVKRIGEALITYYSFDGTDYYKLRMGYFPNDTTVQIGLIAAAPSPDGDGFEVVFSNFTIHSISDEEASNEE